MQIPGFTCKDPKLVYFFFHLTMFLFRTKENEQRKYVDLIKEAAGKWPSWDPHKTICVSIASPLSLLAR